MSDSIFVTCDGCGFRATEGDYDICGNCGWELDSYQLSHPDDTGANPITLRTFQLDIIAECEGFYGPDGQPLKPRNGFEQDPDWRPLGSR